MKEENFISSDVSLLRTVSVAFI